MNLIRGYQGKVLRVNLSTGEVKSELLDERVVSRFLGGRGIGAYLLYRHLAPGIDPLSPENVLIFSTGPLAGTPVPGSNKYVITTKSPLTGIYLMTMSSRGFGAELRKSGWDVLIVEGRAPRLSYLWIKDDRVEIRDASAFKGADTEQTALGIRGELRDPRTSVVCIGPAGENLVKYAAVLNEGRAAGRGGAGAVMGSKNLKAIAVRGAGRVEACHPEIFGQALKLAYEQLEQNPSALAARKYGTSHTVDTANKLGVMPVLNWQESYLENITPLSSETMISQFVEKSDACAPCSVRCIKVTRVQEGPFKGYTTDGPEYETIYSFGTSCGIYDYGPIICADKLCDLYGLDTMSAGSTLSFAMECFEKGLLTRKETDGLDLKFGNAEVIPAILLKIALREGVGDLMAEGSMRMARAVGQGSEHFAMHCKGMELGGYDPRAIKGMALVYACGPRGGCHHAGGRPFPDEVTTTDRFSPRGKSKLVKLTRDARTAYDSSIKCNFARFKDEVLVQLLSAATGRKITAEDMPLIGDRVNNVERMFNVREGLSRKDDILPPRLLKDALPEGPAKGQTVELETMLDEFYPICGWDPSTGFPLPAKLSALDLAEMIPDLPSGNGTGG